MTYLEMTLEAFLDALAKGLAVMLILFTALGFYYLFTGVNIVSVVLSRL